MGDAWKTMYIDTRDRRDQQLLVSPPKDDGEVGLTELPNFRSG